MHFLRRPFGRAGLVGAFLAMAVVALLVSVPVPARASPTSQPSGAQPFVADAWSVTWNNVDVQTASTSSSALGIDFTSSATVLFSWNTGSSAKVTVGSAQLQMFYFGFAVASRTQTVNNPVASSNSSIPLTWTPLSIAYVLEGVYKITASFIAPNQTTLFSENFYVRANALFGFVAAIPIVLLILAIYEIYALVRSGRYAALGRKLAGSPPSNPPASTPPPSTPPTESPPPAETAGAETPPPGGSS
ncbi:MAG: hypothetical protein ABSA63_05535 [Thermoplasmata archaeon]|jgi:hypothetical protein